MCGICGWIGRKPSDMPNNVGPMLDALSNRGPDERDVWGGNGHLTMLGHTRLSIIDVEGSAQPLTNEDGTIILTFNGEIYNYQDLRRFLLTRGHMFRTQGDAEVLVHLYEEYGSQMVDHLDGMFAFGIYDERQHTLLLARDRIGIKPLYYWFNQETGELLFASDMGAMLANKSVPRRLNKRALAQYLHFGYVMHPESWLQGVYQLEPGHTVEWKAGTLKKSKYYAWQYAPQAELADVQKAATKLRQALGESVTSHLIADVPLGSFLSGGLDSATVTGIAQQARQRSGDSIDSFTVRFWIASYDESSRARSIADDLGTRHNEVNAEELQFDRAFIDSLVASLGEPFADTSALAVYLLCQQARPFVKVALSGDGGDELFYGYRGLRNQQLARRFRLAPAMLRRIGASMTTGSRAEFPRRLNKYLRLSLHDDAGVIIDWHRRWEWSELHALLGEDNFNELFPSRDESFPEVRALIGKGETGGFLEQQIRFHMLVNLPCDHLFKVDRMSMAHGLEVRVPMLANNMLEYGQQLPAAMRMQTERTKEPLRTLAETLAPTLAQPAPKQGFSFPLDRWMRGKVAKYWREWELTPTLSRAGFSATELDRLIDAYDSFDANEQGYNTGSLSVRIFDLMLLAVWMNNYHISV